MLGDTQSGLCEEKHHVHYNCDEANDYAYNWY